jgi:hypothetical protein
MATFPNQYEWLQGICQAEKVCSAWLANPAGNTFAAL